MQTLESIKGIEPSDLELLEAAGWVNPRQLAQTRAELVLAELTKANGVLRLVEEVPPLETVIGWVTEAREMTGEQPEQLDPSEAETIELPQEDDVEPSGPVNYEDDPEVGEMLKMAPFAIPVPNRLLAEREIAPMEISVAPVLNRAESDLEVRVTAMERPKKSPISHNAPKGKHGGVVKVADSGRSAANGARRTLDKTKVRSIDLPEEEPDSPQLQKRRQTRDERLNLLRTTREKTNRGKKPGTRRYIRGVLHDRPVRVWFGCLIVILFQIAVPLSIVSAALLIFTEHSGVVLDWVPSWIIAFPLALPILGILYFMISFNVKCRVCGQKVLVHRHCRKNNKAHHVFGLGYVLPLAVQTLLFRWFNCTFCGTSIRIKE